MTEIDNYIKERKSRSTEFEEKYNEYSKRLDVAVAVRQLRDSLHMTQREFAEVVGKPQSTIGRIETGRFNVSWDVLNDIAQSTDTKLEIKYVKK
ncbi:XRE family transcriptional regulator [Companilactobacillus suantsaicola]|uniref:XRE family transcriptional regulator n=1 Tax=Companilactobacillus suantsaicola TaxID=2487723 RepID=A0A4Z0JIL5_9LACO|nr:helix-turn-helix transcriptional regulator [Companilactobacillus suantsaicola]TGD22829.1 XRE family transcriptional regulator [Companilactobacillus suantsaicola]